MLYFVVKRKEDPMFSKKTTVKLMLPAFAFGAFFAACSNDDPISDSKIETVAEVESLPDCNSKNEGEMVLVKKDLSLRVCVNKKWAEVTQNSDGSYDYKCETKALKDSSGLKIICGGDSIGVLLNLVGKDGAKGEPGEKGDQGVKGDSGVAGPQGDPGEAGKSCTAEVLADFTGMKMICGGDSVGVIRNGNDGDNGANGAGCSLKQLDETQLQIKCGNDSTTFFVHSEEPSSSASVSSSSSVTLLKKATVTGKAALGPFENGSVVTLKEMRIQGDSLSYTGHEFTGEVSGLKGNFVIPDVSLDYPYAEVSVTGKWRNEVTGKTSTESLTLNALADFSEGQTEVNVNLLTHLEYARAKKIIKDKKYTVKAAKKIALNSMVSAFGFSTDVGVAEDLEMFVSGTSDNNKANATLLAMTLLFVRDNESDAKIKASIENFIKDVAEDGLWDDTDKEKNKMALWASNADVEQISLNMAIGGVYDVPSYKTMLSAFIGTHYGLGTCSQDYDGVVKTPSINDNGIHFICRSGALLDDVFWSQAKVTEWEPYGWAEPRADEPRGREAESGNIYVYDDQKSKWRLAETDFEFDTYDFLIPENNSKKAAKGHKTGKCYVYEKAEEDAPYAWNVESDDVGDDIEKIWTYDHYSAVGIGICSGKVYAPNENEFGTYREATEIEMYLGHVCALSGSSLQSDNMLVRHESSSPDATDSIFVCRDHEWSWVANTKYTLGPSFTDKRDNNVYKTVTIGNQTWMAEDLRYCSFVGYEGWDCPVVHVAAKYTKSQLSFACPDGWRVPTKADFETLALSALGKAYTATAYTEINEDDNFLGLILGDPYKRKVAGLSNISNIAFNKFGFSAGMSDYWTSTANGGKNYLYSFESIHAKFITEDYTYYPMLRCIQDTPKQ